MTKITVHAVFEGEEASPERLCDYIERYGGSDPVVSIGGGEVGAIAQFDAPGETKEEQLAAAIDSMRSALNWLPVLSMAVCTAE